MSNEEIKQLFTSLSIENIKKLMAFVDELLAEQESVNE